MRLSSLLSAVILTVAGGDLAIAASPEFTRQSVAIDIVNFKPNDRTTSVRAFRSEELPLRVYAELSNIIAANGFANVSIMPPTPGIPDWTSREEGTVTLTRIPEGYGLCRAAMFTTEYNPAWNDPKTPRVKIWVEPNNDIVLGWWLPLSRTDQQPTQVHFGFAPIYVKSAQLPELVGKQCSTYIPAHNDHPIYSKSGVSRIEFSYLPLMMLNCKDNYTCRPN